jgi:S-adenosylmethionine/arginine decarboxylase-like enzyme
MSEHHWFGFHSMIDAAGCNIEKISDKEHIITFAKDLVYMIDMVAAGEPIVEYLCEGDPKVGYSLVQLITTSNITAHFMEETGQVYLDVFSCKTFDPKIVARVFKQYFEPTKMRINFLTRDAG